MSALVELLQQSSYDWNDINENIISDPGQVSDVIDNDGVPYYLLHEVCKLRPPTYIVEMLVNTFEPAIRAKGPEQRLPIHLACEYGASPEVIDLLISKYYGCVRTKDDNGMLPLHIACAIGISHDVVDLLLIYYPEGATMEDSSGTTAEGYANILQDCEVKEKILDCLLLATVYRTVSKAAVLNVTEEITSTVCTKMMGTDSGPLKEREISSLLSEEVAKFGDTSYSSEMVTSELVDILQQSLAQFKDEAKGNRGKSLKKHAKELDELADTIEHLQNQLQTVEKKLTDQRRMDKSRIAKLEKKLTEVSEIKVADGEELEHIFLERERMKSLLHKTKQKFKMLKAQNQSLVEKLDKKSSRSLKKQEGLRVSLKESVEMSQNFMDENTKLVMEVQKLRNREKFNTDLIKKLESSIRNGKYQKSKDSVHSSTNKSNRRKEKNMLMIIGDQADSHSERYLRGRQSPATTLRSLKQLKRIPKTMSFDCSRNEARRKRSVVGDEGGDERGLDVESYYRHKALIESSIGSSRDMKCNDGMKQSDKNKYSSLGKKSTRRGSMKDSGYSYDESNVLDIGSLKAMISPRSGASLRGKKGRGKQVDKDTSDFNTELLETSSSEKTSSSETNFKENESSFEDDELGLDRRGYHSHHQVFDHLTSGSQRCDNEMLERIDTANDSESDASSLSSNSKDEVKEANNTQFLHQILDVDLSLSEPDSEDELEKIRKRVSSVLVGSSKHPNRPQDGSEAGTRTSKANSVLVGSSRHPNRPQDGSETGTHTSKANKRRSRSITARGRLQDKMESLKSNRTRSTSVRRIPRL